MCHGIYEKAKAIEICVCMHVPPFHFLLPCLRAWQLWSPLYKKSLLEPIKNWYANAKKTICYDILTPFSNGEGLLRRVAKWWDNIKGLWAFSVALIEKYHLHCVLQNCVICHQKISSLAKLAAFYWQPQL